MSSEKQGTGKYFAVSGVLTDGEAQHEATKQSHKIATLKSAGGAEGDSYECTLNITVTKSGTMEGLTAGDAILYLSGLGIENTDVPTETGLDLSTVTGSKEFTSKKVTLNANGDTKELIADVEFNNTTSDQSSLAGKTLTVQIDTTLTGCELVTD